MHSFSELIGRCTAFTLNALNSARASTLQELKISGATTHVKSLQMIELQKAVVAVGMFSLFEAELQDSLACDDGFHKADGLLNRTGRTELKNRFYDFRQAINVLKHGRGASYEALISRHDTLDFKIKLPGEVFFCEGDVSEVSTLIEVNDTFVLDCAEIIQSVSEAINGSQV